MHIRQHPDESTKAYKALSLYADMGKNRSLRRLAEEHGFRQASINKWSAKFAWVERIADKEAELSKARAIHKETIEEESARRHLEQAQRLQEIAMGELERTAILSQSSEVPLIRPPDAVKMVTEGFKMERLATGQSTENAEVVMSVRPLDKKELRKLDEILEAKITGNLIDVDY